MSEPAAERQQDRKLEMFLSVPAEGQLRRIASDLATRIAEHLGSDASKAQSLAKAVDGLASRVSASAERDEIAFEFRHVPGALVIEARCDGEASEVRHPLPA
jgi:hypothetical protein